MHIIPVRVLEACILLIKSTQFQIRLPREYLIKNLKHVIIFRYFHLVKNTKQVKGFPTKKVKAIQISYLVYKWHINHFRKISQSCTTVNYCPFLVPKLKYICRKIQKIKTNFNCCHIDVVMRPKIFIKSSASCTLIKIP